MSVFEQKESLGMTSGEGSEGIGCEFCLHNNMIVPLIKEHPW